MRPHPCSSYPLPPVPSITTEDLEAISTTFPNLQVLDCARGRTKAAIHASRPCTAVLPKLCMLRVLTIQGVQLQAVAPALEALYLCEQPSDEDLLSLSTHPVLHEVRVYVM